ncbi:MAG: DtxR family Mn-dependent transcriptional regulator [Marinoscillum sp.]
MKNTIVISSTEENYLKALFALSHQDDQVNITDLSHYLQVSKPSINSMIKNLQAKGLVNYEKYKPIVLSDKGRKIAAVVIRKHRLTEMYLVDQMGFGWEEVHAIAEQIEHINSTIFFDRMDELMGFPKVDPHGSPIPDKDGRIAHLTLRRLSECAPGSKVKLLALENSSDEFLNFLNSREISLGVDFKILSKELFDGSVEVNYLGHPTVTLSGKVSERLLVK